MVYIDTSVLAAYYSPEPLSEKAESVIQQCDHPAISLLVEVEFYSAIARKTREGTLLSSDADRILAQLRQHVDGGYYDCLPLESSHYTLARNFISRGNVALRTLDALHLAICFSANVSFLTADIQLAKAATVLGIPMIPFNAPDAYA